MPALYHGGAKPREFDLLENIDKMLEWTMNGEIRFMEELCQRLDITTETLDKRIKDYSDDKAIQDKVKKLKQNMKSWWIKAGLSGKVNITAWVFCMKNIWKWRDRNESYNTNYDKMDKKELERLAKEAMKVIEDEHKDQAPDQKSE